jgi:dTDP-4-amino-4,6-dideoxygalactose transaminase
MPVHLYGQPAEMEPLLALARQKGLHVIEDASQAHGARYRGARVGSLGAIGVFSFYPAKNLGAFGDGGLATTNDEAIARKIATLRNYRSIVKYHHDLMGENSRLDTVQAAILRAKLRHLDAWNTARRRLAARYGELLRGVGDLILPNPPPHLEHVYHLYVARTRKRDALQRFLTEAGIGSMIHYPVPIHLQKAYREHAWKPDQFPITEQFAGEILSLPLFPDLTDSEQECVAETVARFFR